MKNYYNAYVKVRSGVMSSNISRVCLVKPDIFEIYQKNVINDFTFVVANILNNIYDIKKRTFQQTPLWYGDIFISPHLVSKHQLYLYFLKLVHEYLWLHQQTIKHQIIIFVTQISVYYFACHLGPKYDDVMTLSSSPHNILD